MKMLIIAQAMLLLQFTPMCWCTVPDSYESRQDKLRLIGFWIRNHKFTETDQRYRSTRGQEDTRYFMRKFPDPRLKELDERVVSACKAGLESCINEIYDTYRSTAWGKLENGDVGYFKELQGRQKSSSVLTKRQVIYEPMENRAALFKYRATAMYYMCDFTVQQEDFLSSFGKPGCGNNHVDVEVAFGGGLNRMLTYSGASQDYRTNDDIPYACSQWSFCPDVCCGEIAGIEMLSHFIYHT